MEKKKHYIEKSEDYFDVQADGTSSNNRAFKF